MSSKGKKKPRELAIERLNGISRIRKPTDSLWSLLLDAHDSLKAEGLDGPQGALTLALLAANKTEPIPDATFALTITSAIDQALEWAISTHFPDEGIGQRMFDDNANGPLSTFSAKIKAGYALGVYPQVVRDELDMMRHIRNAFAHATEKLSFKSEPVIMGCAALKIPDHYSWATVPTQRPPPKTRFAISGRVLFVYLEHGSGGEPMDYEDHPMHSFLEAIIPD